MLFSSYAFLLAFLPIALLVYVALQRAPRRVSLAWAVFCSLVFYGWWKPGYLVLLLGSIGFNFLLGRVLRRAERGRTPLLALGLAANLGLLGYYKYANFFVETAATLAGTDWSLAAILLPIGISFFTFEQIAFLVDTYRGKHTDYHIVDYSLFVSFFPQLIAGPIVHHQEILPQVEHPYRLNPRDLSVGLTLLTLGLAKKVLLADSVAVYATPVFTAADAGLAVSAADAWIGTLAFTLQLYFDFSGYSDMAIGIARMFGIKLPLNFASPYKAASVVEFWRCWHMTLSRFLREYLYFPLGGNRKGRVRRYVNLMLTMLLGGLWHGAGWNFALWGGLHGLYLCANHGWTHSRKRLGWAPLATGRLGKVLAVALTFLAVTAAWVPFRAETFGGSALIYQGLLGLGLGSDVATTELGSALGRILPLLAMIWLLPNTQEFMTHVEPALEVPPGATPQWALLRVVWRPSVPWALGLALLAALCLSRLSLTGEFLYYQF